MSNYDLCQICNRETDGGYSNWYGPPFSIRSTVIICYACICALKPKTYDNVSHIGTYNEDIHTLQEMLEDGFKIDNATASIKALGKALGINKNIIKEKLKIDKKLLAHSKRRRRAKS